MPHMIYVVNQLLQIKFLKYVFNYLSHDVTILSAAATMQAAQTHNVNTKCNYAI